MGNETERNVLNYQAQAAAKRSLKWLMWCFVAIGLWGFFGIAAKGTERSGIKPATVQVLSALGTVPACLLLLLSPGVWKGRNLRAGSFWGFVTGICGTVGNYTALRALHAGGDASLVYPLTSLYPLVTLIFATTILMERLNGVQVMGIVIAIPAFILFNVDPTQLKDVNFVEKLTQPWILYCVATLVAFGLAAVCQKLATRHISSELSTVWFGIAFVPVAVVVGVLEREQLTWSLSPGSWALVLAYGALIGIGTLALFAAYRDGKASVVTAITALYPLLTVMMAIPIFNERPGTWQYVAIGLAIAAGVALSYEKPVAADS